MPRVFTAHRRKRTHLRLELPTWKSGGICFLGVRRRRRLLEQLQPHEMVNENREGSEKDPRSSARVEVFISSQLSGCLNRWASAAAAATRAQTGSAPFLVLFRPEYS